MWATAIAFCGRPDTRSFGTATCGLSTAIENYPFSDGSTLNLAISTMADRAKTKYGFALIPDDALSDPAQVVERAVAWLQTGNDCALDEDQVVQRDAERDCRR